VQGWTIIASGTCPIVALESCIAREAPFHPSLTRKAGCKKKKECLVSLFAFQNDSHVGDAHWCGIHARLDILKSLRRKLAVFLLGSNISASVLGHDVPGKRSLVRNPTRVMSYKPASASQSIISELNAISGLSIVQVM
jgi:hypothetical protein